MKQAPGVLSRSALIIFTITVFVSSIYAQGGPSSQELEMAARSPEYRAVAEQFVAAAAARDAGKLEKMLSPAAASRAGKEALQKVLNGQVIPFFADHKEIGRSVTTTNTTDAGGHAGFAYYMYSVPKSGQQKPFVIYVVEENGQKVVANISSIDSSKAGTREPQSILTASGGGAETFR